ncbi:MAG: DUF11 domain-containing protein [Desulfuromonadaceae bacterium]|nr:DUF11 domain-containing protein [Desulfuromonadaceae bacterium]
MKKMFIYLTLAVIGLLFVTGSALAAGTAAGTTVSNQATLDYKVGGVDQPQASSVEYIGGVATGDAATLFTVDRKVDLTVSTVGPAVTITPGGTAAATFTITNTGNDTQDIDLTLIDLDGVPNPFGGLLSDTIDAATISFYLETANVGFNSGDDTQVTHLNAVAPDTPQTVYMVITVANTVVQNDLAVYALRATARLNNGADTLGDALTNDANGNTIDGAAETVFVDGDGSDDTGGAGVPDAQHSVRTAFVVSTASLTVSKSVAVFDTGNLLPSDTYAIPGAVMTYTVNIANSGTETATGIVLVDQIPSGTSFYVSSGPTGGTVYAYSNQTPFNPSAPTWTETPGADANGVDTDVTAIKITVADIAGGANASVTFKVKIP